jgi:hypothetical protein
MSCIRFLFNSLVRSAAFAFSRVAYDLAGVVS